ncbi:MAG: hypothetical protein ACREOO_04815 [bacterium]
MPLLVPIPTLNQKDVRGNLFAGEKPIDLACDQVRFPDGTALTPLNATAFGFLLYRENAGGGIEVWDENEKKWIPESTLPEPQPLIPSDGKWQSLLLAIGQKDHTDVDKFGTDLITHFPKYFVRCSFRGKDAQEIEQSGVSAPSQRVEVFGFGKRNRAGLTITPEPATAANQIGLFLKDGGLVTRGEIRIRETGGDFLLELLANGTSVTLTSSGGISLRPALGQMVRVEGVLAVSERIEVNGVTLIVP